MREQLQTDYWKSVAQDRLRQIEDLYRKLLGQHETIVALHGQLDSCRGIQAKLRGQNKMLRAELDGIKAQAIADHKSILDIQA